MHWSRAALAEWAALRYLLRRLKEIKHIANRPENRPGLRLMQALNVCYARIFHRLEIASRCRVPEVGPGILVCNHVSHLDPFLLQGACPRLVTWMMTHEFYDMPYANRFFRMVEAIRVEPRARDLSALRSALRRLEEGRVIGIFPEGGIAPDRELMPFQTGVALLAIKSGTPVYPAHIEGTHRGKRYVRAFLQPQRVTLTFGEPVQFERGSTDKPALQAATDAIRDAVHQLQRQSNVRDGKMKVV